MSGAYDGGRVVSSADGERAPLGGSTMEFTVRVRRQQVVLVAIAALIALLVPAAVDVAASGSRTPLATVQTRSASCAGVNFYPPDNDTGYGMIGTGRVLTDYGTSRTFTCAIGLPTGAVVTSVQLTLQVPPPGSSGTRKCGLERVGLSASNAPQAVVMGRVANSDTLAHPGLVRLTDSTISHATVDNRRYAYYVQCQLYADLGFPSYGRIYAADVIYTISAAKG